MYHLYTRDIGLYLQYPVNMTSVQVPVKGNSSSFEDLAQSFSSSFEGLVQNCSSSFEEPI